MTSTAETLPEGWEAVALSAIGGRPQYGWTTKAQPHGSIKLLRTTDITSGPIDWSSVPGCASEPPDIAKYELCPSDIVVSRAGSVGVSYLLDESCPPGTVFASYLMRVRPDPEIMLPDLVYQFMQSPQYWAQISRAAVGIGMANVSGSKLGAIRVPVPPRDVQPELSSVLDSIGRHAGSARKHVAAARRVLNRFRQAVLAAAASGRLTADWREVNPDASADDLLREVSERREALVGPRAKPLSPIASQDLPILPQSWRWASVDSLALRVVDGVHKTPSYRDRGVAFVTVRNLTAGPELSFDGARFISEEDHARFCKRANPERGDLLISKDGTIGVTRAVRTDQPFSIFVSVALVKPVLRTMTDYLELALSAPQVQAQMIGVGSGLQHLVLRDLKADGVPIPPPEEQAEIVRRTTALLVEANLLADSIGRASRQLERSQSAVLAKAFRGELTVSGRPAVA